MEITEDLPQQVAHHHLNGTSKQEPNKNVLKNNKQLNDLTILEFYRDTHVLLTGGTGFVGKVVVEKLLRTCALLNTIYIIIRPKRGMNVEQRLQKLFQNTVFDKIKEKDETLLQKIRPIEGDITLPNLGISDVDRRMLIDNVDVVIHSAATIRFNEPLKIAITINMMGTKRMLDLAIEMKKLKSFVYVSTAYSNSDKTDVEEIVYEPPANPHYLIKCMETLSDESLAKLEAKFLTKHPNTYTFTKAVTESLVQEYSEMLPTAIVRPSVVANSWKEPSEGWIDHSTGMLGLMMEIGRGGIQSMIGKKNVNLDVMLVDIVSNTLIVAAWHIVTKCSNSMKVYNCTTGQLNELKLNTWGQMTVNSAHKYPSKYLTWYPHMTFKTNRFWHFLHVLLSHRAPACLADIMLMCQRKTPMMYNFSKKVDLNMKVMEYFMLNDFNFDITNLQMLIQDVWASGDGENFNFDISKKNFKWSSYNEICMLGIRQLVLKDDLSSLSQARRTMKRFYWLQRALQLITIYLSLKMIIFLIDIYAPSGI